MADLIDETMNEIRRNWNITLQDEINPIPLALELLQQSNPAHDLDSFQRLHQQLEQCMEYIIENNYAGFNGAVSTFGGIVESIKEGRRTAGTIRAGLEEFRDQVQYKRADLPELWAKIEQFKLRISAFTALYHAMYYFHSYCGRAEMRRMRQEAKELVAKGFFVPAARILAAIQAEAGSVGGEIEAVDAEFWRELRGDREAFLERLLEEFCQHAFLRVPASTAQLVAQAQATFPTLRERPTEYCSEQARQLLVVPEGSDHLVMVPTEFHYAPASNAPVYLGSLFQAAHALGCLGDFCGALEQRLGAELFQLADMDMRSLHRRFHRERSVRRAGTDPLKSHTDIVLVPMGKATQDKREAEAFAPFLRPFLETLLVRFTVVLGVFWRAAQSPFAEDEVSIAALQSLFAAAGNAVHGEVRNVLGTLLKGAPMGLQLMANAVINNNNSSQAVLLFKFPASEVAAISSASPVDGVLSRRERLNAAKLAQMLVTDAYASARDEYGHRPIVTPSLQYLPLMFPIFAFFESCLEELGLVAPADADAAFLQRYLAEEFLPFLEAQVSQEMAAAFQPLEALIPERLRTGRNRETIPKCLKAFASMFNLLVRLATRIPAHSQAFEGLIQSLCESFLGRLDMLVVALGRPAPEREDNGNAQPAHPFFSVLAAADQGIRELLRTHPLLKKEDAEEHDNVSVDEEGLAEELAEKEACLLEAFKGERSLAKAEIIGDRRRIGQFCLVQRGLTHLPSILFATSDDYSSPITAWNIPCTGNDMQWTQSGTLKAGSLEFSSKTADSVGSMLARVAQHQFGLLLAMRLELRAQSLYRIDLAMREGCYVLDSLPSDPDAYIAMLGSSLAELTAVLEDGLSPRGHRFCLSGLPISLQAFLISAYKHIRDINTHGYLKLQGALRALEQVLTLIDPLDAIASMDRVRAYYVLAQAGPERLIEAARECEYRYVPEQYKALLDSWYRMDDDAVEAAGDENAAAGDADDEHRARRKEYQNMVVRLQYLGL